MRLLHTADWHLGKIVNEFSMIEDQAFILNQLIDILKEQNIDLLIMAGDLYDRSIPPKEAVTLLNTFLSRVKKECDIPILMIAGNHDSNERLEFGTDLLADAGFYIEGTFKPKTRKEIFGDVSIYLMPFADHIRVRHELGMEPEIKNLEEAIKVQIDNIIEDDEFNPNQKNILIMHGYVINQTIDSIEESESERPLSIGTTEYVDASLFDAFDYVALGHLHKAQKVKRETIRYSGSPLKYSKSEANHRKKAFILDTALPGFGIEAVPLKPLRDMRIIKGKFTEIIQGESDDYVFFELEDTTYVMDAMTRLRKKYPNAMGIEYLNLQRKESVQQQKAAKDIRKLAVDELFKEFYEHYREQALDEPRKAIVNQVLDEIEREEDQ